MPSSPRQPSAALPRAWLLLCAGLAALALLVAVLIALLPPPLGADALAWQPALAAHQPWRAVTAAFVHLSGLHLGANLAGCAVLALLGARAGLGQRDVAAGLVALPLTQLGLLLRPDLQRYAGLSGELHALAAIAALTLLSRGGRDRLVGAGIALGLLVKIVLEAPLGPALRITDGFDFAVAPFAHLSGAVAGALAWALTFRIVPK